MSDFNPFNAQQDITELELAELLAEIQTTDEEFDDIEHVEEIAEANRAASLAERKLMIQRDAFRQTDIPLTQIVTPKQLKQLIAKLTEPESRRIERYLDFVNRRLTTLLNPFIPRPLRNCFKFYPQSVKGCPGFLYKAGFDNKGARMWVTPKIPYFFEQGTEMSFLRKQRPKYIPRIDNTVNRYKALCEERAKKELDAAARLLRAQVLSLMDVLRLDPLWYEILYEDLKQNGN